MQRTCRTIQEEVPGGGTGRVGRGEGRTGCSGTGIEVTSSLEVIDYSRQRTVLLVTVSRSHRRDLGIHEWHNGPRRRVLLRQLIFA